MNWTDTPCVESRVGINQGGYSQRRVNGRRIMAHRYAWEQVNGPIPDGLIVCHHCDNPPCINTDHLFLGTYVDNEADKIAKGRRASCKGERNGRARLTQRDVEDIRFLFATTDTTQAALARQFGITPSHLNQILTFKLWPTP